MATIPINRRPMMTTTTSLSSQNKKSYYDLFHHSSSSRRRHYHDDHHRQQQQQKIVNSTTADEGGIHYYYQPSFNLSLRLLFTSMVIISQTYGFLSPMKTSNNHHHQLYNHHHHPLQQHARRSFIIKSTTPNFIVTTTTTSSSSSSQLFMSPKSTINEDEEWNALLSALRMYKAAYGDLKVPSRFIVPSMPPWPEPAHELKLGQRVAQIRSTGKYVKSSPSRRKTLDDMGFLWRLRATTRDKDMSGISLSQILTALEFYKKDYYAARTTTTPTPTLGMMDVPASFAIPDCDPYPMEIRGLPLGRLLTTVLSPNYLKSHPEAREPLAALGVALPSATPSSPSSSSPRQFNDSRYNRVLLALRTYKEKNGNLLVPQPFIVAEDDESWPEETRGLRLGARVNAIRSQGTFVKTHPERREELTNLGFVWELENGSGEGRKRGRKKKVETREVLLGKAPPGMLESDSTELEGGESGGGGGGSKPSSLEGDVSLWDMLNEEGYGKETTSRENGGVWGGGEWDPTTGERRSGAAGGGRDGGEEDYVEEPDFMETIVRQQKKAIEIGIVKEIEENGAVVKGKVQMRHPWFNDDFGSSFTFSDVIEAYSTYKSIYGNFSYFDDDKHKSHVDFIVPSAEEDDDSGMSAAAAAVFGESGEGGIDVESSARAAAAIATAGDDDAAADLISAEISRMEQALAAAAPAVDEQQEPAVTTTTTTTTLSATTTATTTATKTSTSWPAHLAGMNLSRLTTRIRDGDLEVYHDPSRKAQLDELEFPWGRNHADRILTYPFDKTMCALYAYFAIRGDLFVTQDFVMPGEEPWPEVLTGFPLGRAVEYIRRRQNFLQEYHPRKLYLLNMLEFVWFPLDADPLDPDSVEKGWEREHARRVGHPLARINEVPMSVIEALGDPAEDDQDDVGAIDKYADFDYELVRDYYENELGVRDIGKFLRDRGYFQLADEHEETYGKYVEEGEGEEGEEGEEGVDFEYVYEEEEEEEWEYDDELDDEDLEEDDDNDDDDEEEEVDYDVGAEDEDDEEEEDDDDDDDDLDNLDDDDFDIEEEEL